VAFALVFVIALWISLHVKKFSRPAFEGLLYGILASYFLKALNLSAVAESSLVTIVMVVIWISLGFAAFAMAIAGWLFYMLTSILLISVVNYLFFRDGSK
jgi:hypothetical protein